MAEHGHLLFDLLLSLPLLFLELFLLFGVKHVEVEEVRLKIDVRVATLRRTVLILIHGGGREAIPLVEEV